MIDFETDLPEVLINAYKSTNFKVHSDPEFILKIGEFSSGLENLFRAVNLSTGCFITACNPQSVELSDAENKSSQDALYKELKRAGHHIVNGLGSDPSGEWDGEPSFLVLGISLLEAKTVGKKYRQNAIVWCDEKCIPDLVFLR